METHSHFTFSDLPSSLSGKEIECAAAYGNSIYFGLSTGVLCQFTIEGKENMTTLFTKENAISKKPIQWIFLVPALEHILLLVDGSIQIVDLSTFKPITTLKETRGTKLACADLQLRQGHQHFADTLSALPTLQSMCLFDRYLVFGYTGCLEFLTLKTGDPTKHQYNYGNQNETKFLYFATEAKLLIVGTGSEQLYLSPSLTLKHRQVLSQNPSELSNNYFTYIHPYAITALYSELVVLDTSDFTSAPQELTHRRGSPALFFPRGKEAIFLTRRSKPTQVAKKGAAVTQIPQYQSHQLFRVSMISATVQVLRHLLTDEYNAFATAEKEYNRIYRHGSFDLIGGAREHEAAIVMRELGIYGMTHPPFNFPTSFKFFINAKIDPRLILSMFSSFLTGVPRFCPPLFFEEADAPYDQVGVDTEIDPTTYNPSAHPTSQEWNDLLSLPFRTCVNNPAAFSTEPGKATKVLDLSDKSTMVIPKPRTDVRIQQAADKNTTPGLLPLSHLANPQPSQLLIPLNLEYVIKTTNTTDSQKTKYFNDALLNLVHYLWHIRTKCNCPHAVVKTYLESIVDQSLLRLASFLSSPILSNIIHLSPDSFHCSYETIRSTLFYTGRYSILAEWLSNNGDNVSALELFRRIGTGDLVEEILQSRADSPRDTVSSNPASDWEIFDTPDNLSPTPPNSVERDIQPPLPPQPSTEIEESHAVPKTTLLSGPFIDNPMKQNAFQRTLSILKQFGGTIDLVDSSLSNVEWKGAPFVNVDWSPVPEVDDEEDDGKESAVEKYNTDSLVSTVLSLDLNEQDHPIQSRHTKLLFLFAEWVFQANPLLAMPILIERPLMKLTPFSATLVFLIQVEEHINEKELASLRRKERKGEERSAAQKKDWEDDIRNKLKWVLLKKDNEEMAINAGISFIRLIFPDIFSTDTVDRIKVDTQHFYGSVLFPPALFVALPPTLQYLSFLILCCEVSSPVVHNLFVNRLLSLCLAFVKLHPQHNAATTSGGRGHWAENIVSGLAGYQFREDPVSMWDYRKARDDRPPSDLIESIPPPPTAGTDKGILGMLRGALVTFLKLSFIEDSQARMHLPFPTAPLDVDSLIERMKGTTLLTELCLCLKHKGRLSECVYIQAVLMDNLSAAVDTVLEHHSADAAKTLVWLAARGVVMRKEDKVNPNPDLDFPAPLPTHQKRIANSARWSVRLNDNSNVLLNNLGQFRMEKEEGTKSVQLTPSKPLPRPIPSTSRSSTSSTRLLSANAPDELPPRIKTAMSLHKRFLAILSPSEFFSTFDPSTPLHWIHDLVSTAFSSHYSQLLLHKTSEAVLHTVHTQHSVENVLLSQRYKTIRSNTLCDKCHNPLSSKIVCIYPNGCCVHEACAVKAERTEPSPSLSPRGDVDGEKILHGRAAEVASICPVSGISFERQGELEHMKLNRMMLKDQQGRSMEYKTIVLQ
ncbi:hypothetical protein BLNAU_8790 [Blattamonas nauphoetae]|uniref:CNH domain-containing protein n=1 Tax=Blattamonas nauphoetae TaxID=2049346 RepID=A0ABQ9XXM4_9EUKA|nr:hypothetical protein BLNAU_8790 [Blattamonas nauphoetae]